MHVLTQGIDTVGNGFDQYFSRADAFFQHVTNDSVEEGLLVREMPVERPDADAGALGNSVSRGLAAGFQRQFDGDLDEPLSIPLRISPHPAPALDSRTIALTHP
ncbi:hypothetical protein NEE01_02575 [Sphingomonas sp. MMSM24]|uniref:Uncharacterized protein n=1 Tax=Sphingomonas lycopersici TaxID=2951807 RepID=A0AA41Z6C4_9SPHN|nr:hypothetical protein [Sphingomonas lycopersici]